MNGKDPPALNQCHFGDCREVLKKMIADGVRVNMCATSPPYWALRSYLQDGHESKHLELGSEPTLAEYVSNLVEVFALVREVLADDGVLFLNLGSSYASSGISANQSHPPSRVPAYGSDDTEPLNFRDSDYVYRGLCDECLTDFQNHLRDIVRNDQPSEPSLPPPEMTARGNGHQADVPKEPNATLRAAQASTMLESWRLLRGECSRCDSRVSSLSELCSDVRAEHQSVHTTVCTDGIIPISLLSAGRKQDKEPWGKAWEHYTSTLKPKDLIPVPWIVAMALQEAGWWLRQPIVWVKTNPMPESVTDRCTKSHEYVFLLAKRERYFFDAEAIKEPQTESSRKRAAYGWNGCTDDNSGGARTGSSFKKMAESGEPIRTIPADGRRNKRDVWIIPTQSYSGAHFATFPEALVEPMILAGTSAHGHCPACGKGWGRVVEKSGGTTGKSWHNHEDDLARGQRGGDQGNVAAAAWSKGDYKVETLGWQPSCDHDLPPVPGVVLDPFLGSGTVGRVAQSLGRNWLGIELNPAYGEFQANRITQYGFAL